MTNRFGVLSLLSGAFAVAVAGCAVSVRASHIPTDGKILQWLTALGLVNQPIDGVDVVSEMSIFAVNDQNGIILLFVIAIVLAVLAVCIALIAEYWREPTLYFSGGFICGVLAISIIKLTAGLMLFVMGIIFTMILRYGRDR